MGWPFCPNCRHTLTVNATGNVGCSICHYSTNLSAYPAASLPSRTTKSANRPDPLWAKSDEEQAALRNLSEPKRMRVEEPCIKCGAEEVEFYTVQLRSVDEGQTVFYECPKCSHTWSVNNQCVIGNVVLNNRQLCGARLLTNNATLAKRLRMFIRVAWL